MTNKEKVKKALKAALVKQWQLADKLGIRENDISRIMRYELPDETTKIWLKLIQDIANERRQAE